MIVKFNNNHALTLIIFLLPRSIIFCEYFYLGFGILNLWRCFIFWDDWILKEYLKTSVQWLKFQYKAEKEVLSFWMTKGDEIRYKIKDIFNRRVKITSKSKFDIPLFNLNPHHQHLQPEKNHVPHYINVKWTIIYILRKWLSLQQVEKVTKDQDSKNIFFYFR